MGASSGSRTGTRELERRPATWVWGMPLLTHDPDETTRLGEVTAAVSASVTAILILPPTGNSSVGTQTPRRPHHQAGQWNPRHAGVQPRLGSAGAMMSAAHQRRRSRRQP